jgi:hypothetical protein
MKQVVNLPLLAMVLLMIPWSVADAAPAVGTISGTVKDAEGRPLVGALVNIHTAAVVDEVLKSAKTDKQGRFIAANLIPGKYLLEASAEGYKPESIAIATVAPRQTSVFNFKLHRVSDLLNAEEQEDSYKYVMRRNRHIFQLEESQDIVAEKKVFDPTTHGVINFVANQALSNQSGASSFAGVNFALAQTVNSNLELVVAGQTGLGSISPQRIETQASLLAGDNHKFTFTIGYGHLPTLGRNDSLTVPRGLNQYTLHATDRWHIVGPVVILYGFDYSYFDAGTASASRLSPRFNIDLQVSGRDQLFAAIYSPAGADIESSTEFETTRIDFHGPVELINLDNQFPIIDNSRRFEIGYMHTFEDRSRFEAALFHDQIVNRSVGFLSVPTEVEESQTATATGASASIPGFEHRGAARGVRLVYSRPLTGNISTSFGYAFGQGQHLDVSEDGRPNFSTGHFHVLTGKLDADITQTGTKISTVVRLASPRAIFAIDPFQQRMRALDPNVSVYIAQTLPMFDFIPGHWEANIDARNILDSGNGDERLRLAIGQFWRSIRGGFSVRF